MRVQEGHVQLLKRVAWSAAAAAASGGTQPPPPCMPQHTCVTQGTFCCFQKPISGVNTPLTAETPHGALTGNISLLDYRVQSRKTGLPLADN